MGTKPSLLQHTHGNKAPGAPRAPLSRERSHKLAQRKGRLQQPALSNWIGKEYLSAASIARLRRKYATAKPTPHIALQGILKPARLRELKAALRTLAFSRKEADLFSFSQTGDLAAAKNPVIKEFLAVLGSAELHTILTTITGVKSTPGKVDAAGYRYTQTDHLLCHDDGVSSRRVAYVLNLSTMTQSSGGALVFFNSDAKREPTTIAKRIYPKENTLVLFTVTRTSHHMVEEVLGGERLSTTGWFHE